jgi:hypothetical protein
VSTPGANGSRRLSSLGDVAKGAAEDALDLLTAQLKLERLELSADLRRGLQGVLRISLLVPPLVVGYAFAMAALASWLGRFWSRPLALASVATLQLVPATLGLLLAVKALTRTFAVGSRAAPRSPDA